LMDLQHIRKRSSEHNTKTLAEVTRGHILEVLDQTGWMLGGRHGAAERLGLPRTTLVYKMRKLGIRPERRAPAVCTEGH
ncbi:MAG TPA: helix-turn-helix domain-containing protein, partial [Bryobacteraceae bacterium]|nr:helix-turn-helix domain-containing protein [Bryobacteraceae bacterium]